MKNPTIKSVFFFAFLLVATAGCKPKTQKQPSEAEESSEQVSTSFQDEHNSRNSLDWNGTYQGTIPCADCEGIKTRLTLINSGEFNRTRTYLGKEETGRSDSGTFQWNEDGSEITLNPTEGEPQRYKVGENRLFQLDREGNRITGELADQYVLLKNMADYQLENKKWILTELMGKEFTAAEGNNEAFLYFDRELGRISGNNSCNNIMGNYDLMEGNRVSFGMMASTMMACPDMETSDLFNEVLGRADNYTISDSILSLNKARMAPLARFRQE